VNRTPEPLDPSDYQDLVRRALDEDVGAGDLTTAAVVLPQSRVEAVVRSNGACVLAGIDIARTVFAAVDRSVAYAAVKHDADTCRPRETIARVSGPARGVLTAERTALNFLQYLSGIATRTRQFVDAAAGRLTILDTRKTTPGLRALAKYAVRCGGGVNHRAGLSDGILIKDNHIRLAGSVAEAVQRVRAAGSTLPIEVEAQSLADVDAALAAGVDIVMLDNLDDETIRVALGRIAGRARVELSGGMTVERVEALAGCGADSISIGAITHSAPAVDISLEVERLLSLPDVRPGSI
jgi:nicotinate-nucleotide pyrophosphorylase (carboxylating)